MKRKIVLIIIGTLVVAFVGCLVWYWVTERSRGKQRDQLELAFSTGKPREWKGGKVTAETWQSAVRKMGKEKALTPYVEATIKGEPWITLIPINFWGEVIDQFNNPVEGANVDMFWNHANGTSKRTVYTDAQGKFSLTGERGGRLSMFIKKEGYYDMSGYENQINFQYSNPAEETYFEPDKEKPVVFLMKKKGTVPADLVKKKVVLKLQGQGGSGGVDFLAGQVVEAGQGQMQVTTWKPEVVRGSDGRVPPYEWAIEIKFLDGGFVEHHEVFPFLAPESGYTTEDRAEFQAFEPHEKFNSVFRKDYYFHVGNPPRYGRMNIETAGDMKSVHIKYYLNPTPNDRNLESDPSTEMFDFR